MSTRPRKLTLLWLSRYKVFLLLVRAISCRAGTHGATVAQFSLAELACTHCSEATFAKFVQEVDARQVEVNDIVHQAIFIALYHLDIAVICSRLCYQNSISV